MDLENSSSCGVGVSRGSLTDDNFNRAQTTSGYESSSRNLDDISPKILRKPEFRIEHDKSASKKCAVIDVRSLDYDNTMIVSDFTKPENVYSETPNLKHSIIEPVSVNSIKTSVSSDTSERDENIKTQLESVEKLEIIDAQEVWFIDVGVPLEENKTQDEASSTSGEDLEEEASGDNQVFEEIQTINQKDKSYDDGLDSNLNDNSLDSIENIYSTSSVANEVTHASVQRRRSRNGCRKNISRVHDGVLLHKFSILKICDFVISIFHFATSSFIVEMFDSSND